VKPVNNLVPKRLKSLPELHPDAYHGLVGEIVAEVAPQTEADPAAVLVSLIAAAGAMIGDGPHVMIGAAKHPARIWPLIIGRTASGRKGESWAQTEQLLAEVDSDFVANRLSSGLSTGEGVIACFAGSDDQDDQSIDRRLLVIESEFARPLAAARRDGNTLSHVLRDLWDKGRADVMTRGQPLHCRGAHLVVIAHVTPRELLAKLTASDISGGLLNRFLPVLVQRPHLLPDPKAFDVTHLGFVLGGRIANARTAGVLRRDDAAQALWGHAYNAIARDEADGPLGEILARGAAYTMRLALTYALLDNATSIREPHLRAALAVWEYAAASARHVFADSGRKSDAEKLADFLADAPGGRTRTEISAMFGRNKDARDIDEMIAELGSDAATEEERNSSGGRPVKRVYWVGPSRTYLGSLLAGEPQSPRDNEITNFAGQGADEFIRTKKLQDEKPQVTEVFSSDRNFVDTDNDESLASEEGLGTCARCSVGCRRYGHKGSPLCETWRGSEPAPNGHGAAHGDPATPQPAVGGWVGNLLSTLTEGSDPPP
jgi:hypothetical protein